jgi:hypothetical protein
MIGMLRRMLPPLALLLLALASMRAAEPPSSAVPAKHLLLNSALIEKTEGVVLKLGRVTKHPANPLFAEERPWEVRFDNLYPNVTFDEKEQRYRCWYSPFIVDPNVSETPREERAAKRYRPHDREMGVCYAESDDGLHWRKPELGLIEFSGNTRNNLVQRGAHGAGVLFDPDDADPARRFKLLCKDYTAGAMGVAFSPDGLRWSALTHCPEISVPGDTHNNAIWSPETHRYIGITRMKTDQRLVARTESPDFIHWTRAVEVLRGDKLHQTYAMPITRYGGVHLGFVMVLDTASDRVACELAWSADSIAWQRIEPGRALIPTSQTAGDYDWGCVYATAPVFTQKEIRLYYGASNGPHTNWRDGFLALATLRPDGFAGYETVATGKPGYIVTKPITCTGRRLRVSADAAGASISVTVFENDESLAMQFQPITTDLTDEPVTLSSGGDLGRYAGKQIRVAFTLNGGKLYSFSFGE